MANILMGFKYPDSLDFKAAPQASLFIAHISDYSDGHRKKSKENVCFLLSFWCMRVSPQVYVYDTQNEVGMQCVKRALMVVRWLVQRVSNISLVTRCVPWVA
jgi:hypothetical protein